MGDSAPQTDARSLREVLVGLPRFEQHVAAVRWATANHRVLDMFGAFAKERHLIPFQSGNECENWIDPTVNLVYKMNMLVHVGEDILRLLDRVDLYNELFPEVALRFIGFHVMGPDHAYPVFVQPFIDDVRFATVEEIAEYMQIRGFRATGDVDGRFTDGKYLVSDIRPKNVLRSESGIMFVIDADVCLAD